MDYVREQVRRSSDRGIDDLCIQLFDLFCERRRVIPLAFLMRCWPIAGDALYRVSRLADTMDELITSCGDQLSGDEYGVILDVLRLTSSV